MNLKLVLALYFVFIISCKSDEVFNNNNANCVFEVSNNIEIELDSTMRNLYRISQFVLVDDTPFVTGYNKLTNQIDFFNLNLNKGTHSLRLADMGPASVGNLLSFYYHNKDSIFILGNYKIALVDINGNVLFNKSINRDNSAISQDENIDFLNVNIFNDPNDNSPIFFNSEDNSLYFALHSVSYTKYDPGYYTNPIAGRLSLGDNTFSTFPITFPKNWLSNYYPLNKPNVTFSKDKIIYSFKNSSKVYVYDIKSGHQNMYNCSSIYTPNEAKPLSPSDYGDPNADMLWISQNPEFKKMIYDPYKNVYYRFHYGPYPLKDIEREPGRRGHVYLTVMDNNFKVLKEILLEKPHVYFGAVVSPFGVLINYSHSSENENLLILTAFNFGCIN